VLQHIVPGAEERATRMTVDPWGPAEEEIFQCGRSHMPGEPALRKAANCLLHLVRANMIVGYDAHTFRQFSALPSLEFDQTPFGILREHFQSQLLMTMHLDLIAGMKLGVNVRIVVILPEERSLLRRGRSIRFLQTREALDIAREIFFRRLPSLVKLPPDRLVLPAVKAHQGGKQGSDSMPFRIGLALRQTFQPEGQSLIPFGPFNAGLFSRLRCNGWGVSDS